MMGLARYLAVLRTFWGASISAEMEYRSNFTLAAITSLGGMAGNLFGLYLFYRQGHEFDGWSWDEALIVLGLFNVLLGVSQMVLTPNLSRIVASVQMGTLDFVLLKPVDTQFWLSLRAFSPWGLPDLLIGAGLIVYGGSEAGVVLSDYPGMVLPLMSGVFILYSLWFVLGTMSIWFVKVHNATEVLRALMRAGRYPMGAYPAAFRIFFTFVVPVAFMTTLPAEALLGRSDAKWIGGSALLALVLFLGARRFWRFALRFYTSASS